jgi:hypothetical protein
VSAPIRLRLLAACGCFGCVFIIAGCQNLVPASLLEGCIAIQVEQLRGTGGSAKVSCDLARDVVLAAVPQAETNSHVFVSLGLSARAAETVMGHEPLKPRWCTVQEYSQDESRPPADGEKRLAVRVECVESSVLIPKPFLVRGKVVAVSLKGEEGGRVLLTDLTAVADR